MSTTRPELPADFGNPWMANLQEIGLPETVAMTPRAPGWYLLAALLLLGLLWLAWRGWRRWVGNAYRRRALAELARLEHRLREPESRGRALAELSALIKRVALAAYPRAEVASLSGEAWLGFLDRSIGTAEFGRGAGRMLADAAYAPATDFAPTRSEISALMRLLRSWIRGHRGASAGAGRGSAD